MRGKALLIASLLGIAPGCGSNQDAGASPADAAGAPDAISGATVEGTVTLPGGAAGKPWAVRLLRAAGDPNAAIVGQATGFTTSAATFPYSITGVPAGTYFLLGFVDVDGSGGDSSTPGDYAGWFGHSGDGNPPAAANVLVPALADVRFDFSLVLR